MAFTVDDISELARQRGQIPVLCYIRGQPRWLLVDHSPSTLDVLAAAMRTDDWDDYQLLKLKAYDKNNQPIGDGEHNWIELSPISFKHAPL